MKILNINFSYLGLLTLAFGFNTASAALITRTYFECEMPEENIKVKVSAVINDSEQSGTKERKADSNFTIQFEQKRFFNTLLFTSFVDAGLNRNLPTFMNDHVFLMILSNKEKNPDGSFQSYFVTKLPNGKVLKENLRCIQKTKIKFQRMLDVKKTDAVEKQD